MIRPRASRASALATPSLAVLVTVSALACKKPAPLAEKTHAKIAAPDDAAATASPEAAASSSAPVDATAKPQVDKPPPGPTADAVLDKAKKQVAEAVQEASGEKPCPKVLPLLDVSYSLVHATSPLDEHVLGVFAECASHAEHWRLLRDLAEDIAAGDKKLETTYFLPRAFVGLTEYDHANTLAKATLRNWPKESEAYTTGALAALRAKDFEAAVKAADQALLLSHKHQGGADVSHLAHALRGAALLRMGKIDDGVREIEQVKGHEEAEKLAGVTLDEAKAAKDTGLLAMIDVPKDAYPALATLYEKKVAPVSGLVTVVLQNTGVRPLEATVTASMAGAEAATVTETVQPQRPLTVVLTPKWKTDGSLVPAKKAEEHDVTVAVDLGKDHKPVVERASKVMFEPASAMPKVLRSHAEDLRSAFAIDAAWVTPKAPAVVALVEAAKARLKGDDKKFEGSSSVSLPQAQALWNELRSRGVSFHRDPAIDSEAHESVTCRLPSDTLDARGGNSIESSVLFASLLEAIGLEVLMVELPGHRLVGWVATHADLEASDTAASTVKSPPGQAFFLETTTVGEGPFDAAVLQGAAQWVAATTGGLVASGRAGVESVAELRHKGVVPLAP
jgi:tetratricopeptide (TPR) repeat protein